MPEGGEVFGQGLVFELAGAKLKPVMTPSGLTESKQQVEAFIPAQAVAPANVSLPGQPTGAPAFGGPGGNTGTVQDF